MGRKYLQLVLVTVSLVLFQGCSIKNEGAIDLRKTNNKFIDKPSYICTAGEKEENKFKVNCKKEGNLELCTLGEDKSSKYLFKKEQENSDITLKLKRINFNCNSVLQNNNNCKEYKKLSCKNYADNEGIETILEHKNFTLGKDAEINKDDFVSVYLKTAYIKDFNEIAFNIHAIGTSKKINSKNGEIAIIADVKEFNKEIEIDFNEKKEGRVVFYSDDILPEQFLNFNNLPIYGPKQYEGNPFLLKFAIFEMDVSSNNTKGLLDQLANMGSKAYAPASPVLKVLNSLGQSFLGAKGDDILFRYVAVANDNRGSNLVDHFTLEVGNYVLIRSEIRNKPINWKNLVLNPNDGKLYIKGTKDLFTEETYLVVEINKGVSNTPVDFKNIEYTAFLNNLRAQSIFNTKDSKQSVEILKNAIKDKQHLKTYSKVLNKIEQLKDKQLKVFEKKDIAESIIETIGKNLKADGTLINNSSLNEQQIENIISKLKSIRQDKDNIKSYSLFKKEEFYKAVNDSSSNNLNDLKEQLAYNKESK